ncbi:MULTISPECIES: FliH/SctL family protein [unclassified Guyparkeria]|uniref:FliH/SctL family protein n=1 Tax=unclassified Guyparkeria TaxID=2626246 RepID=UPI0012E384A7|nr:MULTISPECIES: FliH/SctL family protein [unclassified Guyparkeria]
MSSSNDESLLTRPLEAEDWQALVDAWELPDFADAREADETEADPATAEEVAAAREEAERQGYEAGLQKGRDAGYQEGLAAAREEIEQIESRLRGWLTHLERPLALLDDEVTEQLTALATQIARVMVAREVQIDNSGLPSIARDALGALPVSVRTVIVRCAPADESALKELLDDARFESLDLRPDPAVSAGGLVVESGDARVDASLANRWAATLDHLIGRVYPGPDQAVPTAEERPPDGDNEAPEMQDEAAGPGDVEDAVDGDRDEHAAGPDGQDAEAEDER